MAGLNKYHAYPEYRDSGMEWLGEIPRTWQAYTGKRLFSSVRTPALSNDEQLAASQKYGVIPQTLMMQLNDSKVMLALKGTDSFRHVEKNNFVISLRSFEGGIEHSNYQGCVSPAYTVLKSVNDISFSFYRYLLKSEPYISALQASTDSLRDGKSINYEQFGAITLPSPSLPEQSIIAHFLDHETAKIDNLIEKQQQLIELLKEKRQAVISHAVTKGLNPDVPMKDSGVEWLGEVPKHWHICKLKWFANLKSGDFITSNSIEPEGNYPVYGGNGLRGYYSYFTHNGEYVLIGRQGALCGNINYAIGKFWAS
ncbi:TPA: restriction endonuclease subunit S, partial [Escherichia coli]|nr:restriction endonuclease subunit S [Escherichia coli]